MELPSHTQILYLRADGSYSDIILKGGKKIKVSQNLKHLMSCIPMQTFYRCHHSYIINRKQVTGFDILSRQLILDGVHKIPISKKKLQGIDCKIHDFTKSKILKEIR
jgi:two-component system, LytTR family, response regulator